MAYLETPRSLKVSWDDRVIKGENDQQRIQYLAKLSFIKVIICRGWGIKTSLDKQNEVIC